VNRRFWPLEYGAFGWLKRSEHRRPAGVTLARAARPGWSAGPPAAGTPGSRC